MMKWIWSSGLQKLIGVSLGMGCWISVSDVSYRSKLIVIIELILAIKSMTRWPKSPHPPCPTPCWKWDLQCLDHTVVINIECQSSIVAILCDLSCDMSLNLDPVNPRRMIGFKHLVSVLLQTLCVSLSCPLILSAYGLCWIYKRCTDWM